MPATIAAAPPPPSQLEAAVVIADDVEAGRPAAAAAELRSASHLRGRTKIKPNSLLAARAAEEYVYVGQDLRRIAIVAASLFGVLFALWLILVVAGVSALY